MSDVADIFSRALRNYGINATVSHEIDTTTDSHVFMVEKTIAGKVYAASTTLSQSYLSSGDMESRIAVAAERVANDIEDELSEQIYSTNGPVNLFPYGEPSAECMRCGAVASIDADDPTLMSSGELSVPQLRPLDGRSAFDSLNDYRRVLLKLYLIGQLQDCCKPPCSSSASG